MLLVSQTVHTAESVHKSFLAQDPIRRSFCQAVLQSFASHFMLAITLDTTEQYLQDMRFLSQIFALSAPTW